MVYSSYMIDKKEVFELRKQGLGVTQIGRELGISKQRIYQILNYALNPELTFQRMRYSTGLKKCFKCRRILPLNEFHKNRSTKEGLCNCCKECNTIRVREYRHNHKDTVNRIARKSYRNHKKEAWCRTISNLHFPNPQQCSVKDCPEVGHRHHSDYNKPNIIVWLCRKHHMEYHQCLVNH